MKLFPNGEKVYSIIARYGELLSQEQKEGYEAGDISALIVPFLVLHNIRLENIANLAATATVTDGAINLISRLEYNSWKTFCLTSSYEQYALHFTHKLGIYAHHLASTHLPLSEMHQAASQAEYDLISGVEKEMLAFTPGTDDTGIKQKLDRFYYEQLPATFLATYLNTVKPVGGKRKLDALNKLATKFDQPLSKWVLVGSNYQDAPALRAVEDVGGLSIAFNADNEALSNATFALASTNIYDLLDVLTAWQKGGRNGSEKLVREKEKTGSKEKGYFNWLSGKTDISQVSDNHSRLRQLINEKTSRQK